MLRRTLIAALPALALAFAHAPARAGEPEPKAPEPAYVDLKPVGMPILSQGRLVIYVFVTVRLNLAPGADVQLWRSREPMFRDALVRAGYRTPFGLPDNASKIDAAKLSAALMRDAQAIAGPAVVRSVTVLKQDPTRRPRQAG